MDRRTALTLMAGAAAVIAAGPSFAMAAQGNPKDQLTDMLKKDHDQVKKIISQLADKNTKPEQRRDLMAQLKQGLIPHMKAEEAVLYPALLGQQKGMEPSVMALEEHRAASTVLSDLEKLDSADPKFVPTAMVLKELLTHHIKEEESKVFDAFKDAFTNDQAQDILAKFQAEKQKHM